MIESIDNNNKITKESVDYEFEKIKKLYEESCEVIDVYKDKLLDATREKYNQMKIICDLSVVLKDCKCGSLKNYETLIAENNDRASLLKRQLENNDKLEKMAQTNEEQRKYINKLENDLLKQQSMVEDLKGRKSQVNDPSDSCGYNKLTVLEQFNIEMKIGCLQVELLEMKNEKNKFQDKYERERSEVENLQNKMSEMMIEMREKSNDNDVKANKIDDMTVAITDQHKKIERLNRELEVQKTHFKIFKNKLKGDINKLEHENIVKKDKITELSIELCWEESEVEKLQKCVSKMSTEMYHMSEYNKKLEKVVENKIILISDQNNDIDNKQKLLSKLQMELTEKHVQINCLQNKLEVEIANLKLEISENEDEIEELQVDLKEEKSRVANLQCQVSEILIEMQEKIHDNNGLEKELCTKRLEVEKLQNNVLEMSMETRVHIDYNHMLEKEMEDLQDKYSDQLNEVSVLKVELRENKRETKILLNKNKEITKEITEYKLELNRSRLKLKMMKNTFTTDISDLEIRDKVSKSHELFLNQLRSNMANLDYVTDCLGQMFRSERMNCKPLTFSVYDVCNPILFGNSEWLERQLETIKMMNENIIQIQAYIDASK